jgi:hypothetical protein
MTEPENFLQRWSKRKLAERERAIAERSATQRQPVDDAAPPAGPPETEAAAKTGNETFDLASLPPLDSIAATTDVTAFLRPGVPPELTRAALRRAWTSDPAIRDFVGPVENGWDFNDPTAMAGFGAISAAEVARLASQLLGELPAISETSAVKTEAGEDKPPLPQTDVAPNAQSDTSDTTEARRDIENDAAQQNRSKSGRVPPAT